MWSIKILKGSRAGEKFDLKQGDNLIGRSPSCDIAIQSTGISKEHARISVHNNEVTIYDLQSTNGTFVNGVRVHKQKLKLTDKISIFDILLGFESKTASPEIPHYHQIPTAFHGSAAAQYSPIPSHSEIPTTHSLEKKDFLAQAENYLEDILLPGVYKIPENLEMKWSVGLLVFIFILVVTILSVFPMIELTKNGIQRESQRRALSLSKNLAERYQISVKEGMESSFSTSTFEREEGVESAYIISSGDGTIIAPVKKIGIRPDDAFVHTARRQDQAQVNQISDNLVGATFPIKTFDADAGSVKVIAHSVIIYDMGSLAIDTGRTISLFAQVLGIAAAFGFLLYYFIFKIMEFPLKSLSKQLDAYLKNGHTAAESSFQFLALQDLVNHINTLMSRASNPTSSSHSLALVDPQTEAQNLIQNYPAGSLAIDKNGYILAVNEQFLDIAGLSSQNIQGYKIDQLSDQALILSIKDLIEQSQNSNGLTVFNSLEFSGRNIRLGLQPLYDKTDIKYFLLTMQTNEGGGF